MDNGKEVMMEIEIYEVVKPYTMTSFDRVACLVQAVQHIVSAKIDGDFVECGVWKGGSMMAAALTLKALNSMNRRLYLYDTFDGMSAPTAVDVSHDNRPAVQCLAENPKDENNHFWAYSPIESVRSNMCATGYPEQLMFFVKGKVEDTIPATLPDKIAMLRLDTDWYESTRHELKHLYPRLVPGGVLIIDDYGFWKGARKAVDEFLETLQPQPILRTIDETGRFLFKN